MMLFIMEKNYSIWNAKKLDKHILYAKIGIVLNGGEGLQGFMKKVKG